LWLAPRHPERAAPVGQLLTQAGLTWQHWHKIKAGQEERRETVVLIDTVGDFFALYSLADLIFVGGSLIRHGGQNILEPVAWGKVPLYGPHLNNFQSARQMLEEVNAGIQIADSSSLAQAGRYGLDHPEKMQRRGQQGRQALQTHQGAARRQAEMLLELLEQKREGSDLAALGD
jgi:3-deoxy-D-manno-octulosonic-acid transferase